MMGLAPAVLFQGWANVIRTQYLIPAEKDAIYVQSAWLGAIVNLIINALLIPHFKALGAAIGTVCAECAVASYQTYRIRRELPILNYLKQCIYYVVPSIFMIIAIKMISNCLKVNSVILLIAEIVIGGIIYVAVAAPFVLRRYRTLKGEKI